jgi:hypothetical protein
MSDARTDWVPVSGSCSRCGCALGFRSSQRQDDWFCCGACSNSSRCVCGCKPEFAETPRSDDYVPGRRMFAARRADGLKTRPGGEPERRRAFPFADPQRGR